MNGVGAQVQVYFAQFKLIQYKMAYRISRLTNIIYRFVKRCVTQIAPLAAKVSFNRKFNV